MPRDTIMIESTEPYLIRAVTLGYELLALGAKCNALYPDVVKGLDPNAAHKFDEARNLLAEVMSANYEAIGRETWQAARLVKADGSMADLREGDNDGS